MFPQHTLYQAETEEEEKNHPLASLLNECPSLLLLRLTKRRHIFYNAAPIQNIPPKLQCNATSPLSKNTVTNQMPK